jgi:hypothetical protein
MRHANSDVLSFVTTTIGHAAMLDVCEDSRGMRLRKFNPSEDIADADRPLNEAAE